MYYSVFETTKNGVLFGFIYVAMGCVLAQEHKNLNTCIFGSKFKTGSMLTVSIIAVIVEWYIRNAMFEATKSCNVTLALVPLTFVGGIAVN